MSQEKSTMIENANKSRVACSVLSHTSRWPRGC
jgi:hypothetical protein